MNYSRRSQRDDHIRGMTWGARTTILAGPVPWISQLIRKGPPRPSATGNMPFWSGSSFHTAVGNAGCLRASATVGSSALLSVTTLFSRQWNPYDAATGNCI